MEIPHTHTETTAHREEKRREEYNTTKLVSVSAITFKYLPLSLFSMYIYIFFFSYTHTQTRSSFQFQFQFHFHFHFHFTMVKPNPKYSSSSSRVQGRKTTSSASTMILKSLMMFTFAVLILLALGILSIPSTSTSTNSREVPKPNHHITHTTIHTSEQRERKGEQWVEVISWEPRAFLYHNFLSKEECEYLINIAKPHMEKSTVVDSETGKSKDSRVRTSSGTFLARGRDKIVRTIENRIADFTFIPIEHGEGLQVLHYEVGQKYEPHFDYFLDEYNTKNGGQRIATVLMYLTDVEEGGETVFPTAKGNISSVPWWNELSECGKKGLALKPKRGDALLFWSMKPDATVDTSSLHGSCPVIKGDKWSCTKWMRVNEYKA